LWRQQHRKLHQQQPLPPLPRLRAASKWVVGMYWETIRYPDHLWDNIGPGIIVDKNTGRPIESPTTLN